MPTATPAIAAVPPPRPISSPASRSATRGCSRESPDGPFSLLKLWNRAEAEGRLFGLVHDGDWFHVGTPQALADAERVAAMKGVFSIGIDRRFADELAAGVLAEYGRDPLKLADILILLPTRRSVRSLREAFLRASDGKPTLLPRMAPLGDLDDDVWDDLPGGEALTLPPAIGRPEREALLSELVLRFHGRRWRADRADLGAGAEARARAGPACSTSSRSTACRSTSWKRWSTATSPPTGAAR